MIRIKEIRSNSEEIIERLSVRSSDAKEIIEGILKKDEEIRQMKIKLEQNNRLVKEVSNEIKDYMSKGDSYQYQIDQLKIKSSLTKSESAELNKRISLLTNDIDIDMMSLPNMPDPQVPIGNSEEDNVIVSTWEGAPNEELYSLEHWYILNQYQLADFELGNKVTGAGFPFMVDRGAKLQRALIQFFLDQASEAGYIEMNPPLVVNQESAYGTGQLPDKDGQMYHITEQDLYLIPTAEVPVTNIHRNMIYKEESLPIKHCAYSPCFRVEAGSYGSHVRGLNRVHQFEKVEIVQVTTPEKSNDALMEMVEYVSSLLKKLNLTHRIVKLCSGDLGFASSITYDFEVWSEGQEKWLEVSSVSNFKTFQSVRMNAKFGSGKHKDYVHTLNGSALALPRIMAAILENNNTVEHVNIPDVLVPYTKFSKIDRINKLW